MAPQALMCGYKLNDNKLGQQHCPLMTAPKARDPLASNSISKRPCFDVGKGALLWKSPLALFFISVRWVMSPALKRYVELNG